VNLIIRKINRIKKKKKMKRKRKRKRKKKKMRNKYLNRMLKIFKMKRLTINGKLIT